MKKPKVSQIHLDEMGNFVWPLIDGTRTVYEIAELVGFSDYKYFNKVYKKYTGYSPNVIFPREDEKDRT